MRLACAQWSLKQYVAVMFSPSEQNESVVGFDPTRYGYVIIHRRPGTAMGAVGIAATPNEMR
jgi:hypothetical protein